MSEQERNQQGGRATNSVLGAAQAPDISDTIQKASRLTDKVRVVHGANHGYYDNLAGKTVGAVRKSLRNVFNIPGDALALVEGKQVGDDHVITANSSIEFLREAGVSVGCAF